jgi:hypothetical protein
LSQRSFFRSGIFLALATGLLGLVAGLLFAIKSPAPAETFARVSYRVREAFGFEKNWAELPGPAQATGRSPRDCPKPANALVLVIGGQSNASNVVPVPYDVKNDVSVWFNGRCYAASDPMLGATADRGSVWSLLGDRLAQQLGRPVVLIVGAVGGTQFGDWLDPRSGYYADLMGRVTSARAAGYQPAMILWHQGETDAEAERNMTTLKADVTGLVNKLLSDIPAPLYLFQASRCIGPRRVNGIPAVVEVLQQVAAADPRIITGMNTDTLGRDYRWDTCHFNSMARTAIVDQITPDLVARLQPG